MAAGRGGELAAACRYRPLRVAAAGRSDVDPMRRTRCSGKSIRRLERFTPATDEETAVFELSPDFGPPLPRIP